MRLDPSKGEEFTNSRVWQSGDLRMSIFRPRDPSNPGKGFVSRSFSGNERNRLFLQTDGNFDDASLVSGADFREDGRGFALLDFDRDGWIDIALTSTQRPRFRILRNTIGDRTEAANGSIFVSLVGGHQGTESQTEWSPRDAFGARALAWTDGKPRIFHLSCGEGFSVQNGKWIHIGMGTHRQIDRLEISWPSGKQTFAENIAAGARITLYENEQQHGR